MRAGKLRHRIAIQENQSQQDPTTGEMVDNWVVFAEKVPAEIAPLSGREFVASKSEQSKTTARITIRYRQGITSAMRILHKDRIYNIEAVLTDDKSGVDHITMPVSEGVNNG